MKASPASIVARAWRRGARLVARKGTRPAILMYHRIGRPAFDPWGLSVSPERFRDQLRALVSRRQVLSVDELVAALDVGEVPPFATAITFDDGYADNFSHAKPMLEELQVPATVFLTTAAIGSPRSFWWDELGELAFRTSAGATIDFVTARGIRLTATWQPQGTVPGWLAGWRAAQGARCDRTAAYLSLWSELQRLDADERSQAMETLRGLIGAPDLDGEEEAAVMSAAMAGELASEYVAVGSHGRSHVPLTALAGGEAEGEIAGSRRDVQSLTGVVPTGFAYPHGEHDDAIVGMVEAAGYGWAVTTRQDTVEPGSPGRYALPRLAVAGWSGAELLRKIGWRGG